MVLDVLNNEFRPTGLGDTIFRERYARDGETWEDACRRVARSIATAEENGKAAKYEEKFYNELVGGRFMPGGRIWYGAGRKVQQLLNCFVIPTEDTIEGWGRSVADMMTISSRGGGVGANFSPLRGRGYEIGGMGGEATGAVSLMAIHNECGNNLVGGGGRRLALMQCLNINHPDIEEFMDAKLIDPDAPDASEKKLSNANISVVIPPELPTEEFQRLVREEGEIELRWGGLPDKLGRSINARKMWDRIVYNAWASGEPGVLNGYEANKMNNVAYHWPLISTNPCGEIWLPAYGCCDLGALVLPRFVVDGKMDWDALEETVRLGVRFLDDVLDVNHYPLPEIEKVCREERRIGLGVMGLHSMLLDLGLTYNGKDSFAFVDKLFGFIKNTAYDESITLSAEKGAFPAFNPEFINSGFMKTMKPAIRRKVKHHGIRNCALLTIAPTGTTGLVQGVTGGIEPNFAPVYVKRRKVAIGGGNTKIVKTLVVSQEYLDHPDIAQGAYDVTPRDHMEMQKIVQRHIDNAVSKTINLPKDYPVEDLADLWLEYLPHMKGSTFYREGSRGEEPMQHIPVDRMQEVLATWDGEIEYEVPESLECPSGVCEVRFDTEPELVAADAS